VLTILHSLKSQWHTHEDTDEDVEAVSSQDDDLNDSEDLNNDANDETENQRTDEAFEINEEATEEVSSSLSVESAPSEEKSLTSIVEEVVKPVLMNRLAEQLLSRSVASNAEEVPVIVTGTENNTTDSTTEEAPPAEVAAQSLVHDVVSTLVDALEADQSPEAQEAVSKQFLVNYLGKLPTAESLLAQSDPYHLEASFEASLPGYPEMPALLFEGENEEPLPVIPPPVEVVEQPATVESSDWVVFEQPAEEVPSVVEEESPPSVDEEAVSPSLHDEERYDEDAEEEEDDDDSDEEAEILLPSPSPSVKVAGSATPPKPKPKKNVPRSKRVKKNTGKGKK
jgi:hypothetical protein